MEKMKFSVDGIKHPAEGTFIVPLRFENVSGAEKAVKAIAGCIDAIKCPAGFNGLQLALALAELAGVIYNALKAAR